MEIVYFQWSDLVTPAAAIAVVLLITQYAKAGVDKVFGHFPTRLFVLLLSFLIVLGAQAFTAGIGWADAPLIVINTFVVALAAMGAYEATFAKGEKNTEPPNDPGNPA